MKRRRFLSNAVGLGVGAGLGGQLFNQVQGAEPPVRPGHPIFHVGLAAYSFRNYFKDMTHERQGAIAESKRIDMFDFIDYCAEQGVGAEVTSYYFPPKVTKEWVLRLKRHAYLRAVDLSGTSVGNQLTLPPGQEREEQLEYVKRWIRHAGAMGIGHLRVFAGAKGRLSHNEAKALCIEGLQACCDYAADYGVILGIENHGGIVAEADELLDIIKAINSPWVGINLDSANFHTDDPYADFAKCAPYAVNVQLKTEIRPRNGKREEADMTRFVGSLIESNYQGYIVLEYEAAEDPYLAVPKALKELRRTIDRTS